MRRRAVSLRALLWTSTLTLLACGRESSRPLKIGCLLSLSGKGATIGEETRRGIELALAELNDGTFRGHPLEIDCADTRSDPARALTLLRESIERQQVAAVLGLTVSDEVLNLAPLANQRRVVLLSTNAVSDDIRTAGDYVFRLRESAATQAAELARGLVQRLGKRKIAVLFSTSANGISYRDAFADAVARLGAPNPNAIPFSEGRSDYRREIEAVRAIHPEAVFLTGFERETGMILKSAFEMGFRVPFAASAGGVSSKMIAIAGPGAEGLLSASARFDRASTDPVAQAFIRAYEARFGEPANRVAANGYDAVKILADLIGQGATGAEELKDGLYRVRDFVGAGGTTSFDENGEVAKPIALYRVEGGELRELK